MPENEEIAVDVKNVSKMFGGFSALKSVSLDIRDNESFLFFCVCVCLCCFTRLCFEVQNSAGGRIFTLLEFRP